MSCSPSSREWVAVNFEKNTIFKEHPVLVVVIADQPKMNYFAVDWEKCQGWQGTGKHLGFF